MGIRSGFLAVILMVTMLFLLLPSPAVADTGLGTILLILAVAFIVLFAQGEFDFNGNGYFSVSPGDIFVDIQGLIPNFAFSGSEDFQSFSQDNIHYNIDWLLTERHEGRAWVGAGFTVDTGPGLGDLALDEFNYGTNVLFGYMEGPWHHKGFITFFPDGEFQANGEIAFRF
jgi:hypothetical protein